MGQELLSRGMKPKGTLWSASALLDENYHDLLLNAHLDYIKAGAEVIVTNTFATRRIRLVENKVEHKFKYLNTKAGEIAKKTKDDYPNILIAGGLPPQNSTYKADDRSEDIIKDDFYNQAKLINPYIDFFYFDVLSSIKEINIATQSIGAVKNLTILEAIDFTKATSRYNYNITFFQFSHKFIREFKHFFMVLCLIFFIYFHSRFC